MAIFHHNFTHGSRGGGQSAGAKLDYITRDGKYENRPDLCLHVGHQLPIGFDTPKEFWNLADESERKNARLFSQIEVSLPVELGLKDQIKLVEDYIKEIIPNQPCTYAIHEGKGTNPHCHLIFSDRTMDHVVRAREDYFKRANKKNPERGGAAKDRKFKERKFLDHSREKWADVSNEALVEYGVSIDHRSLKAQGIKREPGIHQGADNRRAEYKYDKPRKVRRYVREMRPTDKGYEDYKRMDSCINIDPVEACIEADIQSRLHQLKEEKIKNVQVERREGSREKKSRAGEKAGFQESSEGSDRERDALSHQEQTKGGHGRTSENKPRSKEGELKSNGSSGKAKSRSESSQEREQGNVRVPSFDTKEKQDGLGTDREIKVGSKQASKSFDERDRSDLESLREFLERDSRKSTTNLGGLNTKFRGRSGESKQRNRPKLEDFRNVQRAIDVSFRRDRTRRAALGRASSRIIDHSRRVRSQIRSFVRGLSHQVSITRIKKLAASLKPYLKKRENSLKTPKIKRVDSSSLLLKINIEKPGFTEIRQPLLSRITEVKTYIPSESRGAQMYKEYLEEMKSKPMEMSTPMTPEKYLKHIKSFGGKTTPKVQEEEPPSISISRGM